MGTLRKNPTGNRIPAPKWYMKLVHTGSSLVHTPSYLQRSRHGIYYLRIAVPPDLIRAYGKREIKRSLKTRSKQTATLASLSLAFRIKRYFEILREQLMKEKNEKPTEKPTDKTGLAAFIEGEVDDTPRPFNPNEWALSFTLNTKKYGNITATLDDEDIDKDLERLERLIDSAGGITEEIQVKAELPVNSIRLSELIDAYAKHKKVKDSWIGKSESQAIARLNLLPEIIGNIEASHVTYENALEVINTLKELPKNHKTSGAFAGKTIKEILKTKHSDIHTVFVIAWLYCYRSKTGAIR